MFSLVSRLGSALALCWSAGAALAQDSVANFYRGKQIAIIVGTAPGGG